MLKIDGITKKYRNGEQYALSNVSFKLNSGELLALVGESGSGKSTLLRIIAGLEHSDLGEVTLFDRVLVAGNRCVPPHKRDVGLLFQDYALFPHLNVFQNIAFGLHEKSDNQKKEIVDRMLSICGLSISLKAFAHELSGGQQQRVALARALAPNPKLLLLDEPFSNLDAILREQVREEVKEIVRQTKTTTILVTHDVKDALCTADRIAVLNQGHLYQFDTPEAVYKKPLNDYVANLFGKYNRIKASLIDNQIHTGYGKLKFGGDDQAISEICFRPEQVVVKKETSDNMLCGVVNQIAYHGDRYQIKVNSTADKSSKSIYIDLLEENTFSLGDIIYFEPINFNIRL